MEQDQQSVNAQQDITSQFCAYQFSHSFSPEFDFRFVLNPKHPLNSPANAAGVCFAPSSAWPAPGLDYLRPAAGGSSGQSSRSRAGVLLDRSALALAISKICGWFSMPQAFNASNTGASERPNSLSEYSTRGGISRFYHVSSYTRANRI
jgi:hypothetical protein